MVKWYDWKKISGNKLKIGTILPASIFVLVFLSSFLIQDSVFAEVVIASVTIFLNAPSIVSLTASDPDGGDAVYGDDDVFTISFDQSTNRPTAGTKSEIDNVFEFRQGGGVNNIGADYVGTWVSPSLFQLRVVDSTGNTGPQIGQLTVKVKEGGNLKSETENSRASTSESPFATGDFGTLGGPTITSLKAEDPAPVVEGYSVGDTITVRFDVDTNEVFGPTLDRAELDDLFIFSEILAGPSPGDYSAVWTSSRNLIITVNDITGVSTPQVGVFSLQVNQSAGLKNAAGTSLNSTSISPLLEDSFGSAPGPSILSFTVSDPDGGDAVYGDLDVFEIEFSELTNQPFGPDLDRDDVDSLLTFSDPLADPSPIGDYSAQWIDPIHLRITVLDADGGTPMIDDPGMSIQGTKVTVKESAGLKSAALDTEASMSQSPPLQGNFGMLPGPSINLFEAADPQVPPDPGFTNGDTLTWTFDENTNRVIAAVKGEIDDVFEFRQGGGEISLGADYVGTWVSPSVFQLRIVDVTGHGSPSIGGLSVKVRPDSGLKNEAGNSLDSVSESPTLIGDLGLRAGPLITSLIAEDTDTIVAGHSDLDIITVRFDVDTNLVVGSPLTRQQVNDLFDITQSLGDDYSAEVENAKTVRVTIDDATTDAPPEVGVLRFIVKESAQLKTLAEDSLNSTSISSPLDGTFGQRDGPFIVSVTALDQFGKDGLVPVYGLNDTITVEFSELTNEPFGPILDRTDVDSLFTFSEALAGALPGNYTAEWINPQNLEIKIANPTGAGIGLAGSPESPTLQVTVKESADLKDADETTFASTSESPPLLGNFGILSGPLIDFIVAQDISPISAGLSDDDIITVTFNQPTNQPDVSDTTAIDALFAFKDSMGMTNSIGSIYSGIWFDPLTLIITIDDATGGTADVGDLTLTVKLTGDLKNLENTSDPSISMSPLLIGDFGLQAAPSIIALVADDPQDPIIPGFSNGDTITVIFSQNTTAKQLFGTELNKTEIDNTFTFTQSIGDNYSAEVKSVGDIVITIEDSDELPEPPEVDQLQVIVKESANLRIALPDTSEPSIAVSPFLTGGFGGFIDDVPLCEGGNAFTTYPDGKTAQIEFAGEGCGGFTFETADQDTSERIEFLGDPLRITPSGGADCSVPPHCDISFVFREDQIPIDEMGTEDTSDDAPVDPFTEIKILKDVDGDEDILQDFDGNGTVTQSDLDASNEVFNGLPLLGIEIDDIFFNTPNSTVTQLDDVRYKINSTTPSNSKFAIGGVKALALGALATSVGPGPAPGPAAGPAAAPGPAGSGGAGGNAAAVGEEGLAGSIDLQQVKLFEATWDKCDEGILRVIAGPPGPGLSVKSVAAMGGIAAMNEAEEQPFLRATVYELPISELETFIRVQVEAVIGREPSLAQRSLDLKECTGSIGGYSESEDFATPPLGVPAGAFPSTATLFEDGLMFETNYNDLDFGVGYWMPEGEITEMDVDEDAKAITFSLSEEMDGRFIISLPRGMISADDDQFILMNPQTSEPMEYDILESGVQYVTLEMTLPEGTDSVTVVGTTVVPEFGVVVFVILVLSIACIIIISKTRPMSLVKL